MAASFFHIPVVVPLIKPTSPFLLRLPFFVRH
jgi:hypothetical protein